MASLPKQPFLSSHSQEEGRGRRRHEGIGDLGWNHLTGPVWAGPRQTLVACAAGRRVCVRGRPDVVQAGSIALESPSQAVGPHHCSLRIAWSAPSGTGGGGEGVGVGWEVPAVYNVNFCKINCICKSNIELLDYANSTAEPQWQGSTVCSQNDLKM